MHRGLQRIRRYPALSVSLCVVLLLLGWTIYELAAAVIDTPGRGGTYAAQIEAVVAKAQEDLPGPDSWAEVVHALEMMEKTEDSLRASMGRTLPSGATEGPTDWPADQKWPPDESVLGTDRSDAKVEGYFRELLARLRSDGVMDAMEKVVQPRRAVRPIPRTKFADVLLPELSLARRMRRIDHARMMLALADGDIAEFVRAMEESLALVRVMGSQATEIDRLVSISNASSVMDDIRRVIADGRLSAAGLRGVHRAIERQLPMAPPDVSIEGERLGMLDFLEWTHSESGRAIPSTLRDMSAVLSDGPRAPFSLGALGNVAAIGMASKRDSTHAVDEYFRLLKDEQRTRARDRTKPSASEQFRESLPASYAILRMILPTHAGIFGSESIHRTEFAATRAMVALERYRQAVGMYPALLQQLVPRYLDELPQDQYGEGELVYVLRDPRGATASQAYLLYSVGNDRVDNAGAAVDPSLCNPWPQDGKDVVFNLGTPRSASAASGAAERR